MRRPIPLLSLLLAAACYGATEPSEPAVTPAAPAELRLAPDSVVCDGCTGVAFSILGTRATEVLSVEFRRSNPPHVVVPAAAELRRFTDDSGVRMNVTARFTGSAEAGDYDVVLHRADGAVAIPRALVLARAVVGPDAPRTPGGTGGRIDVTLAMTGADLETLVEADATSRYEVGGAELRPGTTASIPLSSGTYVVRLNGLAANCVPTTEYFTVAVPASGAVPVRFDVACSPAARVRVALAVTGQDPPAFAAILCDLQACGSTAYPVPNAADVIVTPGTHEIALSWVPSNCRAGAPVSATAVAGSTTDVTLQLTCDPFGTVRVSLEVTGAAPLTPFWVSDGTSCGWYDDCGQPLTPGVPLELRYPAGVRQFKIIAVPANCTNATVQQQATVISGGVTEVVFRATCS